MEDIGDACCLLKDHCSARGVFAVANRKQTVCWSECGPDVRRGISDLVQSWHCTHSDSTDADVLFVCLVCHFVTCDVFQIKLQQK